jgi:predicted SAM-dependent methyltransferase
MTTRARIRQVLASVVRRGFGHLGLEVRRIPVERVTAAAARIGAGARLYVGCGEDHREGYVGCDIRRLPSVQLVCRAWEISKFTRSASEIYSRHTLEHLSDGEARAALHDWYEALAIGGRVEVVVPDLDFHLSQWLNALWNSVADARADSDARWSFAGLYGWQRHCDPREIDYDSSYWDVHKSGYNAPRFRWLLEAAGFSEIQIATVDRCHLTATAVKLTNKGERQVAPDLGSIRPDHVGRYRFALKYVQPGFRITDAACGIGYGANLLSGCERVSIEAIDVDEGALEYARRHYSNPAISFRRQDLVAEPSIAEDVDLVVSFETIEHLSDPMGFLRSVHRALRPTGLFICSTPNEETMPLRSAENPYHFRHYRPAEFEELLRGNGFFIVDRVTQTDRNSEACEQGWHGLFNIAVCRKDA